MRPAGFLTPFPSYLFPPYFPVPDWAANARARSSAAWMSGQMFSSPSRLQIPAFSSVARTLADADYFSVGTVDTEQLLDYARRLGLDVELVKKLIPHNI